ncbi:hypothetical protein B0H11DRAFT_1931995 [Mycena galericulata]|nr:hypothetical protein B0H11DRAFT_1931995 [Mycena galericulata]
MQISTTGMLDAFNAPLIYHMLPTLHEEEEPPASATESAPALASSKKLLAPHDADIAAAVFMPGMTAMGDTDGPDCVRSETPSPVVESYCNAKRNAHEAYQRALRSGMACLEDMNDLGLSQQAAAAGLYGAGGDEALIPRSWRPTGADAGPGAGQLRSIESLSGLRGGSMQTNSVATTDSSERLKDKLGRGDLRRELGALLAGAAGSELEEGFDGEEAAAEVVSIMMRRE